MVGTPTAISVFDTAGAMTIVAGYGVVPGQPWAFDEDDSHPGLDDARGVPRCPSRT